MLLFSARVLKGRKKTEVKYWPRGMVVNHLGIKTSEPAPVEKRDCKKSISAIQVIGDVAEVRVNPGWDNHAGRFRQLLNRKKAWMWFWSFYSRWWLVTFGITTWLAQAIQLVWKACWMSGWKKGCQPAGIKTSESAPIAKRDCKKSASAIQVIGDLAEVRVNTSWDNHVARVR